MKLLLARHGNTFAPGDTVVWAGTRNDLPLVARGRAQAVEVADALRAAPPLPAGVYCGPLARTREYAEIICRALHLAPPIVDARLGEIDYGDWTGLTQDEVTARFGAASVAAWDERAEWPRAGNWGGDAAQMLARVQAFVQDMVSRHASDAMILAVTSNGTLRSFAALDAAACATRRAAGHLKVKTGHLCALELRGASGPCVLTAWDVAPAALSSSITLVRPDVRLNRNS